MPINSCQYIHANNKQIKIARNSKSISNTDLEEIQESARDISMTMPADSMTDSQVDDFIGLGGFVKLNKTGKLNKTCLTKSVNARGHLRKAHSSMKGYLYSHRSKKAKRTLKTKTRVRRPLGSGTVRRTRKRHHQKRTAH